MKTADVEREIVRLFPKRAEDKGIAALEQHHAYT